MKSLRTILRRPFAIYSILLLASSSFLFSSCEEKEVFEPAEIESFMPVTPGKYIVYRIDSLVFTNFGRNEEIHRYQVMHRVDAQINDNQGRPAYRVFTFIRDSLGTQPWQASGTYSVTLMDDQVEIQEDNLRFIKLHAPVNDGFNWKGNRYMPPDPYDMLFPFTNDDNMDDWDYYYNGSPASFSYRGFNYSDVLTVEQVDETFNVPITNPGAFALKSRSVERYAKDIGLVFRQYELWDYQPNTGGPGGGYKTGFGITMWMIDHN